MFYNTSMLGKKLKEARNYRGMSQEEAGEILGIQKASYGKYELGRTKPSADDLAKLATEEQVDISFFFIPEMSIEKADLRLHIKTDALEIIASKIADIEQKIEPSKSFNETEHLLKVKPALKEIIEILKDFNQDKLHEVRGAIKMLLHIKDSDNEKGNQNVG